jgi:hypothetical protein
MLEYLNRKEKILVGLKNGLTNKGYSFKTLAGINGKIDLLQEIKTNYNYEVLKNLIESTNYSIINQIKDVKHGLDNVSIINDRKSDFYLYAIKTDDIKEKDNEVLRESFLSDNTLIYIAEKSIGNFYVIFSKKKYEGKHEYIANRWQQGR